MSVLDLTNPVLRGIRSGGVSIEDAFGAMDLAEYWNSLADPKSHDPEWSNKQIAQARKVLLRRQARMNMGDGDATEA